MRPTLSLTIFIAQTIVLFICLRFFLSTSKLYMYNSEKLSNTLVLHSALYILGHAKGYISLSIHLYTANVILG